MKFLKKADPSPSMPSEGDAGIDIQTQGLYARNIYKQYKQHPVLRDVSIHVRRGEAVALLGPNGAGKTTCFYIITGLLSPDSGSIHLDGKDITGMSMYRRARRGIGYLPQESSIFRSLNVEENIRAVLQTRSLSRKNQEEILEELLVEFSITQIRETPATALSGGERRRVEIARALAADPRFLLVDEPLAGIDPIAVADIRHIIGQLKERGIGVLITDHNVRDTLGIVDRAYILNLGQVLYEGTPAEIVAHEEVRKVYLGKDFTF